MEKDRCSNAWLVLFRAPWQYVRPQDRHVPPFPRNGWISSAARSTNDMFRLRFVDNRSSPGGIKKERVIQSNHTASIYIVTLPTSLNRDHRRRRLSPGRGGAPLLAIISRFGTTDPRHRFKATFSSPLCKSYGESRALQRRRRTGCSAKFAKEIR